MVSPGNYASDYVKVLSGYTERLIYFDDLTNAEWLESVFSIEELAVIFQCLYGDVLSFSVDVYFAESMALTNEHEILVNAGERPDFDPPAEPKIVSFTDERFDGKDLNTETNAKILAKNYDPTSLAQDVAALFLLLKKAHVDFVFLVSACSPDDQANYFLRRDRGKHYRKLHNSINQVNRRNNDVNETECAFF